VRILAEQEILCNVCGAKVRRAKFCVKCGALLEGDEFETVSDDYARLKSLNEEVLALKRSISPKLDIHAEKLFLQFREELNKLITLFQHKTGKQEMLEKTKQVELKKDEIRCQICGAIVPAKRFCVRCGSPIFQNSIQELQFELNIANSMHNLFNQFKGTIAIETLSSEEREMLEIINNAIAQFIVRLNTRLNSFTLQARREQELLVQSQQKLPGEAVTELKVVRQQEFERSLINNWFYYLAVILFSIGLTITIYFVVVELESVRNQVITIYSIGGVILLLGVVFGILGKIAQRKVKAKVRYENDQPIPADETAAQKIFPWRTVSTTVLFISFIVLFTGGIVGIAGDLGSTFKLTFILIAYVISALAFGLALLNDSELLVVIGLVNAVVYTSIDLLWTQFDPVLTNSTSLVAYLAILVVCTLISIFAKKWTGMLMTCIIIPIMLFIPKIARQVAHEGIILILIPIAVILVVKFTGESLSSSKKHALVFFSYFFPTIAITVLASPQLQNHMDEMDWSAFHWAELVIFGLSLLSTGFAYQFIAEKELHLTKAKQVYFIFSLIFYGLTTFIYSLYFVRLGLNTQAEFLIFFTFFLIGLLSSLKLFSQYFSPAGTFLALGLGELHLVFLLTISQPTKITGIALYFVGAIIFPILTVVNLSIPRGFTNTVGVFIVASIGSVINILLLGLLGRIDQWFAFAGLLLLLLVNLLINIPLTSLGDPTQKWRYKAIVSSIASVIVLSAFLVGGKMALFSYEAVLFFIIFIVSTLPAFFKWEKKKEGIVNE